MARERRPEDWERDLAGARPGEEALARLLRADPRITQFKDRTRDLGRLDFAFSYRGSEVQVDLKEKINPTSRGLAGLWPAVPPEHIFVLDETVYRRIVWQGGGGYLVVHDHPGARWAIFGPWELTLGPRLRYRRWSERTTWFAKGKLMLDLRAAAHQAPSFSVDDLLEVIDRARAAKDAVGGVEIAGESLPEVGGRSPT